MLSIYKSLFEDKDDKKRWEENAKSLLSLLDKSNEYQRVLIAEIKKNLGDFEGCISDMESIDNNEAEWLKEIFINECKRKNRWVVELN